jgi:low affinity Fe/Cu permease
MPKQHGATSAKRSKAKAGKTGAAADAKQAELHQGWFTWFAHITAHWTGKPAAFLIAFGLIILWGVTGPLFGFSDTWQLVVNTATTIVTFLMVFLIQNTQNRDTMALQIKLADLIITMRGTNNKMAIAEDMDDEELEALHKEYRKRAEQAEASLKERRSSRAA